MGGIDIAQGLVAVALVILSSSLHEFGHAAAAYLCGDPTAKEQGRLTINPLAHIDPVGSVLIPLLMVLTWGSYIGYAKPVPYNPRRLRNPRRDELIVALAGPFANILQACLGALAFHLAMSIARGAGASAAQSLLEQGPLWWLFYILQYYVVINCSLAFFNLLPVPPLDGSKLLLVVLSGKARQVYYQIQQYALPVTLALIWIVPRVTGLDPLGWWLGATAGRLSSLLLGW